MPSGASARTAGSVLKTRLEGDLRAAMKAGDVIRRETLRMCLAAIHNEEVARRAPLDEDAVLAVLGKQAKMRRESIEAFAKGKRDDLVQKERAELAIIESYMPAQLSADEIRDLAKRTIAETGATSPRDQGRVMQKLMPQLRGRADGKAVGEVVGKLLSGEGGLRPTKPQAPANGGPGPK